MQRFIKQNFILSWNTFWQKHNILPFFLLFIISFLYLLWLQYSNSFADPDSFYHAKIIWMMQEKISNLQMPIFNEFPWLYYTVLKTNYIDHHFLYHLLSIPFLLLVQLIFKIPFLAELSTTQNYQILIGFKLATIAWATSFILIFYFLLKKLRIKGAFFYSLLLLITNPFVFRLSLGKTTASSLLFLFLGIYLCYKFKKYQNSARLQELNIWWLFALSFFYVWLYGGWPLMLILVGAFILAETLVKKITFKKEKFIKILFSKINLKIFFTTFLGLLSGLIINPYFPKNLTFYYHQIYEIAIVNYQEILNVGAEWYPYNFFELLTVSSPVFLLLIPAVVFFAGNIFYFIQNKTTQNQISKKQMSVLFFSFILAIIFLMMTLRARRNVEYLFPFLALFIASSFNLAITNFYKKESWKKIPMYIIKNWLISGLILGFFCTAIPFIVWRDIATVKNELSGGYYWNSWKSASNWLKINTNPAEIIFHSDWDDWPMLFFFNTHNYYIVGLDPTFMYKLDPEAYNKWSNATLGQNTTPLSTLLKENFDSKYILTDTKHKNLEEQIKKENFEKVFEDENIKVYKLIE